MSLPFEDRIHGYRNRGLDVKSPAAAPPSLDPLQQKLDIPRGPELKSGAIQGRLSAGFRERRRPNIRPPSEAHLRHYGALPPSFRAAAAARSAVLARQHTRAGTPSDHLLSRRA